MIAYQEIGAGGGNLKTVKFTVPGTFWNTANSSPYTILGASKNHYHIPLSYTYYYNGGANQVYNGALFMASLEMIAAGTRWSRQTDPFQFLISATGVAGIYQCLAQENLDGYCYTPPPIDNPQNDLVFYGGIDDPSAQMPNVKFELVYYTYKP